MMKTLLISALMLFASSTAVASDTYHEESRNAINVCTPALTQYDIGIRRRPMAIINEGTSGSFINCGFSAPTNSYGVEFFSAWLINQSNTDVTVHCTGTAGVERKQNDRRYYTRSVTVPAGGSAQVKWTYQSDNNGHRWNKNRNDQNNGLQCLLPPGLGIGDLPQGYRQK